MPLPKDFEQVKWLEPQWFNQSLSASTLGRKRGNKLQKLGCPESLIESFIGNSKTAKD